MEARDSYDVAYLVLIIAIQGLAFFVIAICYAQIYFSLGKETRQAARCASRGEMTVAKKMALLVWLDSQKVSFDNFDYCHLYLQVFTNFACWAPIAFFGLTALAGWLSCWKLNKLPVSLQNFASRSATHRCGQIKDSSSIFLPIEFVCWSVLVRHSHRSISTWFIPSTFEVITTQHVHITKIDRTLIQTCFVLQIRLLQRKSPTIQIELFRTHNKYDLSNTTDWPKYFKWPFRNSTETMLWIYWRRRLT